jgi:hypothetical protein
MWLETLREQPSLRIRSSFRPVMLGDNPTFGSEPTTIGPDRDAFPEPPDVVAR